MKGTSPGVLGFWQRHKTYPPARGHPVLGPLSMQSIEDWWPLFLLMGVPFIKGTSPGVLGCWDYKIGVLGF
jgi:hypothetical protein